MTVRKRRVQNNGVKFEVEYSESDSLFWSELIEMVWSFEGKQRQEGRDHDNTKK